MTQAVDGLIDGYSHRRQVPGKSDSVSVEAVSQSQLAFAVTAFTTALAVLERIGRDLIERPFQNRV